MTFINEAREQSATSDPLVAGSPMSPPSPDLGGVGARTAGFVLVCIACTTALLLYPDLKTPFLGDDAFNANFIGIMGYERWSPVQWFTQYNHIVLLSGRLFPGMTIIQIAKFMLTQSPVTMKALNIVAIALNIVTFYVLVRQFASRRVALLAALMVLTTLQVRVFYESISEITIENQAVWELLMLATLAAFRFAKRPTVLHLALLSVLYFVTDATYEISFLFIFVYLGIIVLAAGRSAARRAAVPLALIFASFVALNIVIRKSIPIASTSEYAIDPNPLHYLVTLFNQTLSALPLTYLVANPNGIFQHRGTVLFGIVNLALYVAVAAFAITFFILMYKRPGSATISKAEGVDWRTAIFIAVSIVVVPALLTCLSQRWQHEVKFGLPYQPAYLSGFGFALLLALGIDWLLRRQKRSAVKGALVVSATVGAVLFATYQANADIYPRWFADWKYPYRTIVHSAERGGFGAMPEGSIVLYEAKYPLRTYDAKYQFYMYTHRRYRVDIARPDLDVNALCTVAVRHNFCASAVDNLYYYQLTSADASDGRSELLSVKQFDTSQLATGHLDVRGSQALVYEEGPAIATGQRPDPLSGAIQVAKITDRDDYRLYLVKPKCGTLGLSSIDGRDVTFGFGNGFYPEETISGRSFHWASSNAQMKLVNNTDLRQDVHAVVSFETYVTGTYRLRLTVGSSPAISLPLHLGATTYSFAASLPAGGSEDIRLATDGPRVPSGTDPRHLHVRVFDYTANSTAGACAASPAKAPAQ